MGVSAARAIATIVAALCAAAPARADDAAATVARFTVRAGYSVSVAVADLPDARFLAFDDAGTLFVSRPTMGDIVALRDEDGDGLYEKRTTFIRNRITVHGLCFAHGWLWFTQTGSISKARDTDGDGVADETLAVVRDGALPSGGSHWWRSILVTDDAIYTSIGDSGNITDQTESERQKIWRFDLDGGSKRLFISGIRNTEKLRLRPGTDEVWGCDHGSDWFGQRLGDRQGRQPITDYNPPDELNHYVEGGFYGHPFITGNRVPRYEYSQRPDIVDLADRTTPPEWCFGAHWATNGWTFIDPALVGKPGGMPKDHAGDVFVGCHGSWNRTKKAGYQVARVLFDKGHPYGLLTIVSTLGPDDAVIARPVDCVQASDGSVLFSCDAPGAVYRIRWTGP